MPGCLWFENRRVIDILRGIESHALQLRDMRNIMLMDRAILLAHRDHWTTEPSPTTAVLDRLDPPESALYAELISDAHASSVRLEQECISFSAVEKAIVGRR
jgi:hypothetical protein